MLHFFLKVQYSLLNVITLGQTTDHDKQMIKLTKFPFSLKKATPDLLKLFEGDNIIQLITLLVKH